MAKHARQRGRAPATEGPLPSGACSLDLPDGGREIIVREAPLFLEIAGTRLLTMRTPQGEEADREWALGFLAGEGVIDDLSEIRRVAFIAAASEPSGAGSGGESPNDAIPEDAASVGIVSADLIRVELWKPGALDKLGSLSRVHEMRASCGLCGVASPEALVRDFRRLANDDPRLTRARIPALVDLLRANQPLFDATGGCHGAAIVDVGKSDDGSEAALLAAREDIGRHNALDRAIGACLERGVYFNDTAAVLSGRAGYELVVKCLRVGVPIMLSVGAASTFACELVEAAGATLVGFIRKRDGSGERRMHVYCDRGRIVS